MTDAVNTTTPPEPSGSPRADGVGATGDPAGVPPPTYPPQGSGSKAWWAIVGGIALVVLLLVLAIHDGFRHWFAVHTGLVHAGPDVYYNFWSGFGSDLGEFTLVAAVCVGVYTGVRKVNCHTKGCWRVGKHPLEGTPFMLCAHHHPHVPNGGATHEHILEQHHRYKLEKQAREARS